MRLTPDAWDPATAADGTDGPLMQREVAGLAEIADSEAYVWGGVAKHETDPERRHNAELLHRWWQARFRAWKACEAALEQALAENEGEQ
jgi:hypothetical protein